MNSVDKQKSHHTSYCLYDGLFGASEKTRTFDLLITNQLHYRLCYTSKIDCYILTLNCIFVKG